jgi:hypothetical protein
MADASKTDREAPKGLRWVLYRHSTTRSPKDTKTLKPLEKTTDPWAANQPAPTPTGLSCPGQRPKRRAVAHNGPEGCLDTPSITPLILTNRHCKDVAHSAV